MNNISIWVGSWAAYNAGYLDGRWIKLPVDDLGAVLGEIQEQAEKLPGVYNAEELDIFDYDIYSRAVREHADSLSMDGLNELAERIQEFSDDQMEILEMILDSTNNFDDALEKLENGDYILIDGVSNESDLGAYMAEHGLFWIEIPAELEVYINYDYIGKEAVNDGYRIYEREEKAIRVIY